MPPVNKPNFAPMKKSFDEVLGDGTLKAAADKIGGHVKHNIDTGTFTNACPMRMSYALNYNGFVISFAKDKTSSGADHKWYYYRVADLKQLLFDLFGEPDLRGTERKTFIGKKGIMYFDVEGWNDATGHITLWDGNDCADHCYFTFIPEPNKKTPKLAGAGLWSLP